MVEDQIDHIERSDISDLQFSNEIIKKYRWLEIDS